MTASDPVNQKRLNPLALADETTVRFQLLLFASLIVTFLFAFTIMSFFLPQIFLAPEQSEWTLSTGWRDFLRLVLPLSLTLLVVGVTRRIYRRHPGRIISQNDLSAISGGSDDVIQATVKQLCTEISLDPPVVQLGQDILSHQGQAFGTRRRYQIRLDRGIKITLKKRPAQARAFILHELAHIANADIGPTYGTMALWQAMFWLFLLPLSVFVLIAYFVDLLVDIWRGTLSSPGGFLLGTVTTFFFLLQITIIGLFLSAIQASILRIREYYADWRVVLWGAEGGLTQLFEHGAGAAQKRPGLWARVKGLWQFHPPLATRRAALKDPRILFETDSSIFVLCGILFGLVFAGGLFVALQVALIVGNVSTALANTALIGSSQILFLAAGLLLIFSTLIFILIIMTPPFIMSYLLSATLGQEINRSTLWALNWPDKDQIPYLKYAGYAGLVMLGTEIGILVAPLGLLSVPGIMQQELWYLGLPLLPLMALVAFVSLWLWLIYCSVSGRQLLATHSGRLPPTSKRRLLTWWQSMMLLLAMGPFMAGRFLILNVLDDGLAFGGFLLFFLITTLLSLLLLAVGWLLSLLVINLANRQRRCANCQQLSTAPYTIATSCPNCGQDLAPWAYVQNQNA